MKVQREAERCDLCGKYRAIGVTETSPRDPEDDLTLGDFAGYPATTTETFVCLWCIVAAEALLAKELLVDEKETNLQAYAAKNSGGS